ncbi:hypothetical protein CTAYLR_006611 [Chrysophaeum taylorii]|uniref:IQ motif and ubiquitin-like domain-containing protein n=1 Tax=Chrysophaeum taylorii TaxID=2483200 RepID=A0AAD7XQK5_9STRA|nr:hypothetical protein CTAYLR_006611 [Chrysophaeum taylorii]
MEAKGEGSESPTAGDYSPSYCDRSYQMGEGLDVVGENIGSVVHVEKERAAKPYLGGYRHKKTGVVYHHASSQSVEHSLIPPRKNVEWLRNRDAQTYETKTRSAQSYREFGTQMAREDLHMDHAGDRELESRNYFTSGQLLDLKKQKSLVIQCYWRGYMARRRSRGIRQRLSERRRAEKEAAEIAAAERERHKQHEVERRVNPRSRKDFELLYNELEEWRCKEIDRIAKLDDATDEERKEALNEVLAKETTTLQTIDRLKAQASKDGRARRVERVMDLMAQPKRWEVGDGELQEVHTPFTTRAAELRDLYQGLTHPSPVVDDRLQMLLNVKWTVQEFSCQLTRDIVELCDREADLLSRGRPEDSLEGLRRRLSNLFLQFIETGQFNPEAKRFLKVPNFRQTYTMELH